MKNVFLYLAAIMLLTSACDEIDKFTQFNMDYNSKIIIPSSVGVNLPFNLFTPDINSDSESTFSINNTHKDLIEEIYLKQLNLTLTSPDNGDFSFLKSIEIFISAEGAEEEIIAYRENIPDDIGVILELETFDTDIKEIIKKDEFKLRVNTVTDELIASDHHIDIQSVFFVDAKILGL